MIHQGTEPGNNAMVQIGNITKCEVHFGFNFGPSSNSPLVSLREAKAVARRSRSKLRARFLAYARNKLRNLQKHLPPRLLRHLWCLAMTRIEVLAANEAVRHQSYELVHEIDGSPLLCL